ncbi:MAG: AbrB/MazE/SpoVT family DNA-binding protein [Myxococcaceae bacterium]|nr:AbrB/MazE/SpoVT family DNA-binding protein [Myxococcaceae bacterium]
MSDSECTGAASRRRTSDRRDVVMALNTKPGLWPCCDMGLDSHMLSDMEDTRRAKLFRNGSSQALRIPVDFEFPADEEVVLRREGGRLIIEAAPKYTKESIARAYAEHRRQYPTPDPTLADDMANVRKLVGSSDDVSDPWER